MDLEVLMMRWEDPVRLVFNEHVCFLSLISEDLNKHTDSSLRQPRVVRPSQFPLAVLDVKICVSKYSIVLKPIHQPIVCLLTLVALKHRQSGVIVNVIIFKYEFTKLYLSLIYYTWRSHGLYVYQERSK